VSLLIRCLRVIRRQGLGFTLLKTIGVLADYWFEWWYGVDTIQAAPLDAYTIDAESRGHGTSYEGIRILPVRGLIKHAQRILPAGGTFVDLGCGKAKALLVAARLGIHQVRGIEFARELCGVARKNWSAFQRRSGRQAIAFEVIQSCVTQHNYPADETMYFINNPFDETILARVLDCINASVRRRSRSVLLVICHLSPHYRAVMERCPHFRLREVRSWWGYPFSIFEHVPTPADQLS